MGKKKKKDMREELMFRATGRSKNSKELLDRYGMDRNNYAYAGAIGQGRVHGKGSFEDMEKELLRRARTDYDTRRALEAAAMAGDKDAKKFAKNGIGSFSDLNKVQELQKKQHKEMGNGGSFSSASDFAGLSFGNVEADRKKLIDDLQAKAEAATPEIAPEPPPEAQFTITEEEDSANTEERRKRIADYEAKRATSGFLGDAGSDYMDKYKFNVKKGLKDAGVDTRGPEAPSFIL